MNTSDAKPASLEDQTPRPSMTLQVPSFHVDAAEVRITPYSLHIVFGETLPDGSTLPRVHVALPSELLRRLAEAIAPATAPTQE